MSDIMTPVVVALEIVIFVYFMVLNVLYTLFTVVSLKDIRRYTSTVTDLTVKSILGSAFYKPLSVIVPAYNEEETIVASVNALLNLQYPEFEVIVVNDGSKDKTMDALLRAFRLVRADKPIRRILDHNQVRGRYMSLDHHNLIVIDKKNGGKADALNAGMNASSFPLFCCIDADSLLESEALLRAARLFVEDREVIATGGIVRVLNGCSVKDGAVTEIRAPRSAIECFQAVEYTRGFLSGRTAWNSFGSLLIISGAFGIFRKDMVMAVKGYRHTVGEDMDLVVRLHKHCRENKIKYKVLFVPDPVCWTQVPADADSLRKQRNRWHRGLIDTLWHNRTMFLNPRYGMVGMMGFPYFVFVEALGPVVEFSGYAGFLFFWCLGLISTDVAVLFFLFAVVWGMWINLGSIFLDNLLNRRYGSLRDILKLYLFSVLEFMGYRQLIGLERFMAMFQFRKKGWDKPKRQKIKSEVSPGTA